MRNTMDNEGTWIFRILLLIGMATCLYFFYAMERHAYHTSIALISMQTEAEKAIHGVQDDVDEAREEVISYIHQRKRKEALDTIRPETTPEPTPEETPEQEEQEEF
jgi:hypothetical protein